MARSLGSEADKQGIVLPPSRGSQPQLCPERLKAVYDMREGCGSGLGQPRPVQRLWQTQGACSKATRKPGLVIVPGRSYSLRCWFKQALIGVASEVLDQAQH